MISVAVAYRYEGQFRRLRSTLNKLKSLKFRLGIHRPKGFKTAGQYFEPLKTLRKKEHPGIASGHLRCVISSNLKHYYSCNLGDWKTMTTKRYKLPLDTLQ